MLNGTGAPLKRQPDIMPCPCCNHQNDAFRSINAKRSPAVGDLVVCENCRSFLTIDWKYDLLLRKKMYLRELSTVETTDLILNHPETWNFLMQLKDDPNPSHLPSGI